MTSPDAKVVAIIQARMGSTRLPGKVLRHITSQPMLARVVQRTQRARALHDVVVATTDSPADQPIVDYCRAQAWPVFCGSQADVLDRYYQAATAHHADVVVRITSDCPLIDPQLIDDVVREFHKLPGYDYVSCIFPPRMFPRGLDTEVFSYAALTQAWREAKNPLSREHVTRHIVCNTDRFSVRGMYSTTDLSGFRWTVDEPSDLLLVENIYRHFGHDQFSWQEVLTAYGEHPEWDGINAHVQQKAA